jgi:hypothetical protein
MSLYRKKPVVIEAVQWNGNLEVFEDWMERFGSLPILLDHIPSLGIQTPEGLMMAQVGDYIIRGVAGEFYPCKPAIFEATYEPEPGEVTS